jgi:hypothetical protein
VTNGWERRPVSEIQIGNGTLLATFDSNGEIEQLFAPNIDALQSRVGAFRTSVLIPANHGNGLPELVRIDSGNFHIEVQLEHGSQVLRAEYHHKSRPLQVHRRIGVHPTESLMLDEWKILDGNAGLLHESVPWMGGSTNAHCSLYHPRYNGLVHHRGSHWLGVIARAETHWVRVGRLDEHETHLLWDGERVPAPIHLADLTGYPAGPVQLGWDQAVQDRATWGALAVAPAAEIQFLVVCAESERHLGRLLEQMEHVPAQRYFDMIGSNVLERHAPAAPILERVNSPRVRALCERSIDVLHALQDAKTGALMAAAEVDPQSRMSGGYGYSWPRDGAYLSSALDAWGFQERVEHYFRFLAETQDVSGVWWQRYLATGHAGPSWGRIQVDEPATVISAACWHFRRTRDLLWLESFWPVIEKGLGFLEAFHSAEHPMGLPSHDLWEERMGIHAYSLAAVVAAFRSGAYLARQLSNREAQRRYSKWAKAMSQVLRERFLTKDGRYRRTFYGSFRDLQHGGGEWDELTDVSMLGLLNPFGVIRKRDPVVQKLVADLRAKLWVPRTGGVMRYEWDHYRGANAWVLATLWLGSVELSLGKVPEARECFNWVLSTTTSQGMMAEQVHRETGKPFWVIPLGWSHAMFLLFVREVLDSGRQGDIWETI